MNESIKGIKVLIFDAGDILLDTKSTHKKRFDLLRKMYNLKINFDEYEERWNKFKSDFLRKGKRRKGMFKEFLRTLGLKDRELEKFFERITKNPKKYLEHKLIKGVKPTLRKLKKLGIKIVVLSDTWKTSEERMKEFEKYGISNFIDKVYCSSEIGFLKKYSKKPFEFVLEDLRIGKDEVAFVGHDEREIKNAKACGIKVIVLKPKRGVEFDYKIEDISQLPELLEK